MSLIYRNELTSILGKRANISGIRNIQRAIYLLHHIHHVDKRMVKSMKVYLHTHAFIAKHVEYPESFADTLDRMLGIKGTSKA